MTALDQRIQRAIARVSSADLPAPSEEYFAGFQSSARGKADDVLAQLRESPAPFQDGKPVFVSIGGGDGTELIHLLTNSVADVGILVEKDRVAAQLARHAALPSGKSLRVLEGDAHTAIRDAITMAASLVANGTADLQAVTCHAVIHELFDRSTGSFDPVRFLSDAFADPKVPTWFTYREPGAPEKWPDTVLVQADCDPRSLLPLAQLVRSRHVVFQQLGIEPHVMGDHLRLHRDLAMELLVKLAYLDNLPYELEERSTAVDHQKLQGYLMLAIGDKAVQARRGRVLSRSAPTKSFVGRWVDLGIQVSGEVETGGVTRMPIPESQTRVVAWRVPDKGVTTVEVATSRASDGAFPMAEDALRTGDMDVLTSVLVSRGRAWIESSSAESARQFFTQVRATVPRHSLADLWCYYLESIADLFRGQANRDAFSVEDQTAADTVGLGLLFRAERMEFLRKRGDSLESIQIARDLLALLDEAVDQEQTPLSRYVRATAAFVLNNVLRSGGAYHLAALALDVAQSTYITGIESHDVELAHCHYARNVCVSMTGVGSFEMGYSSHPSQRRFAGALIQLAYSHAAWFADDVATAEQYAIQAASGFEEIGTAHYAERARNLAALLKVSKGLRAGTPPTWPEGDTGAALRSIAGDENEDPALLRVFPALRPSRALGLLQLADSQVLGRRLSGDLQLPQILRPVSHRLEFVTLQPVRTLAEADQALRAGMEIPAGRRIPLLAD